MLHILKTLPENFQPMVDGRSPFIIRKDKPGRVFSIGDSVIFEEIGTERTYDAGPIVDIGDLSCYGHPELKIGYF